MRPTRDRRRYGGSIHHVTRAAAWLALVLPLACAAPRARADQPLWVTGHVADAEGRPMVGAQVAAYDDRNHVMDYARTDSHGDYALALPKSALHLIHRHGKGFFA